MEMTKEQQQRLRILSQLTEEELKFFLVDDFYTSLKLDEFCDDCGERLTSDESQMVGLICSMCFEKKASN